MFGDWKRIALHAGFALTGAATALLGPVMPALEAQWRLGDAQAGRLFTAQFLGAFSAAVLSTPIVTRYGCRRSLTASFLAVAAGFLVTALAPWPAPMIGVCLFGAGLGVAIPMTTLAIANTQDGQSSAALNLLNFWWCAGAVCAGPLATAVVARWGVEGLFVSFALLAALAAAGSAYSAADGNPVVSQTGSGERGASKYTVLAALTTIFLFFYVGMEMTIAGWTPLWASRLGASVLLGASISSIFWSGILLSRLLAKMLLRVLTPSSAILGSLAVSALALMLLLAARSALPVAAGAALAGLGFGLVFPTAVAIYCDTAGSAASRWITFVFAGGALGGATFPAVTGWLVTKSGDVRRGLLFAVVCVAVLAGLAVAIRRLTSRLSRLTTM